MIYDDNTPHLLNWADVILADKDAAKYVSGISFHWYFKASDAVLDTLYKKHPEYFRLNTEACFLKPPIHGTWDWAEKYAFDIIRVSLSNISIFI